MLIALVLVLVGVILIVSNPLLGLIPGILLVVVGLVVGILAMLGRGIGAIAGIGSRKTCSECRSQIPSAAVVCRHCGYRYNPR